MSEKTPSTAVTPLDRSSPVPLWYQLQQALLQLIQNGDFGPDAALPSEKELESIYGVSRITVRRALGNLATAGYVVRESGRGTFVLPPKVRHSSERIGGLHDDLAAQGYRVEAKVLEQGRPPAPASVASRLGLEEGHPVLYVRRLVFADGEPILLSANYHNVEPGIVFTRDELESDSIFKLLEQKHGVVLRRADRTIEATVALESDAKLLGVPPNAPMLLVRLIVYDDLDRPVSYVRALYRGDRYKYCHTVTR